MSPCGGDSLSREVGAGLVANLEIHLSAKSTEADFAMHPPNYRRYADLATDVDIFGA